jgi:F-type H+-transporting ATPase subunit b
LQASDAVLIDWFTVGAQALNFLVLVWLLKRYLYHPVLAAIDAREKQIAGTIAEAASQRTAAEQERSTWTTKNSSFESERETLLAAARHAADVEREGLLTKARADSDTLRAKEIAAAQDDQERLGQELARSARTEVLAIAGKVLGDLADVSLEERIVELFARRLHDMDASAKKSLEAAFLKATEVTVASTFALSDGQRATLQTAIDQALSRPTSVRFDILSDLLCGIQLSAGGEQVAWSIADYLGALDQKVETLLARQNASSAAPLSSAPDASPIR